MLLDPHIHLSEFKTNDSVAKATHGTSVTSGAANTYGTWTQIHAGFVETSDYITIMLSNNFTSATTQNAYVDIGIGATSGAVQPIIEKLCGSHAAAGLGRFYYLPIRIPQGTPIWARHQNTVTTKTIGVLINSFGGNQNPASSFRPSRYSALGAVTASTTGTVITPGTSAEGSWTQIIASTTEDYAGILPSGLFNVDTTMTANVNVAVDIAVGAAGQERVIGENVLIHMPAGQGATSNDERAVSFAIPTLLGIPTGSRLAARASANGTPDSAYSIILLGMIH